MLIDTNGHPMTAPLPAPSLLRPFADILAVLLQPLPPACISSYERNGQTIRYVHHGVLMMLLDRAAGPGCWHAKPAEVYEVCGNLLVKVELTIRAQEGDFTQVGLGWDEDIEDESFGGPIPRAWATGFRRAAMLFGVARRLWDAKQQPMAKLAAHWATGQDSAPPPVPAKPAKAAKAPQVVPSMSTDRAQEWHDLHTLFMDTCRECGFAPGQVTKWIRRDYGASDPKFGTRHMTNEDFKAVLRRLGVQIETGVRDPAALARNFEAKQLRFLQALPEPDAAPALVAAGGAK